MNRKLPFLCGCLFLAGMFFALFKLSEIETEEKASAALYDQLSSCVNIEPVTVVPKKTPTPLETKKEESQIEDEDTVIQHSFNTANCVFPVVDFDSLLEINSELIGWIIIEDTPISYPVVQGEDNQYYLRHLFDRTYSNYGCIFIDARNGHPFADKNTIIYGHHMKNESMFSSLALYKQQDYFDQHPEAMIITPTGNYLVHFFSGFVANTNDVAWETSFGSDVVKSGVSVLNVLSDKI